MHKEITEDISCRIVTDEALPQVMKLWETCFDDTLKFVLWYFARYWKAKNTIGLFEKQANGELLQASAQVIPYELQIRDTNLSCGYIVGVNTAPEARNRGYAKRLLKECLCLQRSRQQTISLLMPFEAQFYYRYGWSFSYFHQRVVTNPNELRCIAKPWGTVRKVELFEAQTDLERIYRHFTAKYHGTVHRTADQWRLQLEDAQMEHTACFLIEDEAHQVQGYFLWTPLKGKCYIREIAWCHERAKAGMLYYLMINIAKGDQLWLELPEDDNLKYHMAASKTDVVLYPFLMARIIDVKQCLEQLHYSLQQAALILKVQDNFAEWNTGIYFMAIQDGMAQVQSIDEDEYRHLTVEGIFAVSLSIESLSQLIMGAESAENLMRYERLECDDTVRYEVLQLLQKLWPVQNNYINEYY